MRRARPTDHPPEDSARSPQPASLPEVPKFIQPTEPASPRIGIGRIVGNQLRGTSPNSFPARQDVRGAAVVSAGRAGPRKSLAGGTRSYDAVRDRWTGARGGNSRVAIARHRRVSFPMVRVSAENLLESIGSPGPRAKRGAAGPERDPTSPHGRRLRNGGCGTVEAGSSPTVEQYP